MPPAGAYVEYRVRVRGPSNDPGSSRARDPTGFDAPAGQWLTTYDAARDQAGSAHENVAPSLFHLRREYTPPHTQSECRAPGGPYCVAPNPRFLNPDGFPTAGCLLPETGPNPATMTQREGSGRITA